MTSNCARNEGLLNSRFYSDAILGGLHRSMAIKEWAKLSNGDTVPLERALAAFDMFVVHERDGDIHDVCIQEIVFCYDS